MWITCTWSKQWRQWWLRGQQKILRLLPPPWWLECQEWTIPVSEVLKTKNNPSHMIIRLAILNTQFYRFLKYILECWNALINIYQKNICNWLPNYLLRYPIQITSQFYRHLNHSGRIAKNVSWSQMKETHMPHRSLDINTFVQSFAYIITLIKII